MAHLLDRADPPDAVFCYSDLVALGAIHTAGQPGPAGAGGRRGDRLRRHRGRRVLQPDGLHDLPDKQMIAETAVERLLLRIASPTPLPGLELRAPHRLIPRQSTLGRPT